MLVYGMSLFCWIYCHGNQTLCIIIPDYYISCAKLHVCWTVQHVLYMIYITVLESSNKPSCFECFSWLVGIILPKYCMCRDPVSDSKQTDLKECSMLIKVFTFKQVGDNSHWENRVLTINSHPDANISTVVTGSTFPGKSTHSAAYSLLGMYHYMDSIYRAKMHLKCSGYWSLANITLKITQTSACSGCPIMSSDDSDQPLSTLQSGGKKHEGKGLCLQKSPLSSHWSCGCWQLWRIQSTR